MEGNFSKSFKVAHPNLALRMRLDCELCYNSLKVVLASKCEGTVTTNKVIPTTLQRNLANEAQYEMLYVVTLRENQRSWSSAVTVATVPFGSTSSNATILSMASPNSLLLKE